MTEWRPIADTNGWYDVSDVGLVRSWKSGGWGARLEEPRILRVARDKRGYPQLELKYPSGGRTIRVHRLVIEAFGPPSPGPGYECAHEDGDKENNAISNLKWKTSRENQRDKERHGAMLRGSRCPTAKISENEVQEIRRLYASGGVTHRSLGLRFGISHNQVGCIIRRVWWAHIPEGTA